MKLMEVEREGKNEKMCRCRYVVNQSWVEQGEEEKRKKKKHNDDDDDDTPRNRFPSMCIVEIHLSRPLCLFLLYVR